MADASSRRGRQKKNPEGRMSLGAHLIELRKRLFRSAIAIVLGAVIGWFVYDLVWAGLRAPISQIAEARNATINYSTITGAFDIHLMIAVVAGIVIASPVWLWQVFAFLLPGLKKNEKKYILGFVFSAIPLFLAGCAAGWYVLPHVVEIMLSFVPQQEASFVEAKVYLDFTLKLILATGIAFVLPAFLVLLNFAGVIQGTTILKGWRWAILAITIFTAIATPAADVISMFMLAVPMVLLYLTACGISILHDKRAAKRADALFAEPATA